MKGKDAKFKDGVYSFFNIFYFVFCVTINLYLTLTIFKIILCDMKSKSFDEIFKNFLFNLYFYGFWLLIALERSS